MVPRRKTLPWNREVEAVARGWHPTMSRFSAGRSTVVSHRQWERVRIQWGRTHHLGANVKIEHLGSGDTKRLEAFLRPRADSSMFLRGNVRRQGIVNEGRRYQGDYVAAFDGAHIVGVVGHANFGTLLPQAPLHLLPALVGAAAEASGRPVLGCVGPADQVGVVLETLGLADHPKSLDAFEGLYALALERLRTPAPRGSCALHGRGLRPSDRQVVVPWFEAYAVEALGKTAGPEVTEESARRFEVACDQASGYVLVRGDSELVSYSGFNTSLPDAVQIGGVFTPPALRSNGFAQTVVAHSLQAVAADGVGRAVLFTDDQNVAAISAYRSLGFQRIGDFRLALL